MSDEPENLVLVYLRRIDSKIDGLTGEVRDLKERVSAVEYGLAGVRRELAGLAETDARLQAGFDRLRDDVTRINRRLDLIDTLYPPPFPGGPRAPTFTAQARP